MQLTLDLDLCMWDLTDDAVIDARIRSMRQGWFFRPITDVPLRGGLL